MFKFSKIKNNVFLQNFIFMHEILNHYHIRLSKISKKMYSISTVPHVY